MSPLSQRTDEEYDSDSNSHSDSECDPQPDDNDTDQAPIQALCFTTMSDAEITGLVLHNTSEFSKTDELH